MYVFRMVYYFSSLPYILSLTLHVILFHVISLLSELQQNVINDMSRGCTQCYP